MPLNHQSINANGIQIHYVSEGQGPLLLFLHGFPQNWYTWRHQIKYFASNFYVVAPDLRGYGETEKPSGVTDYKPAILMEDIKAFIKSLGYEKAILIGHDWGGAIAWNLAIHYPDVVEKLVILNCPHPYIFAKALRENRKQQKRSWYLFLFQIPFLPELSFKIFPKKWMDAVFKNTKRKETFSKEDLDLYLHALQKPNTFHAALNYYRAAFRFPLKNSRNQKIKVPTQLIWAENDAVFELSLTRDMDSLFEKPLKITYIPDCSHWVQEEQPERVNQIITDFLQKNDE